MTTEQNAVNPQTPQVPENDWFLGSLVALVNKHELDIGITLLVGGFLVSGQLVGGARYFDGFGKEFASVFTGETAASLHKAFAQHGDIYKENSDKAGEEQDAPVTYIHLKDTRFHSTSGQPVPGNRGVWWRGRLSEVSGFNLGSLGPEK